MSLKFPERSYLTAWEETVEVMVAWATQVQEAATQTDQAIPAVVGQATRQRAWIDALHSATEANTLAVPVAAFVAGSD